MSDRLAVLNKGFIQQIDAPRAVYARPTNAFVASFIGASNLFAGTAARSGSKTRIETSDGLAVEAACSDGWSPADGNAATALIRPEQFSLAGSKKVSTAIEVEVEQIVFTGLNFQLHGHTVHGRKIVAIIAASQQNEVARVESEGKARLSYDPTAVHILPPDTTTATGAVT